MTLKSSPPDPVALDAADPLAHWRDEFVIEDDVVYLDGNSLGPLPRQTSARITEAIENHWGSDLIKSWNTADWINLPARIGGTIASLIGAQPNEVVASDSTSVNLFKVLSAAVKQRPDRKVILSEKGNFPTDLYIAQGLNALLSQGHQLKLVTREGIPAAIDESVAVVLLTQVDYRTGSRLDMPAVTRMAHDAGALTVWDLAHSAGAIPVDLNAANADFAVGCGYKYLNGGPGAPAFLFVASRHAENFSQPLSGWMGHAAPFEFVPDYVPAPGISRYLCGTPAVLSMVALQSGVELFARAAEQHSMPVIHAKACTLIDVFTQELLGPGNPHGLTALTPAAAAQRGSQASFALADGDQAYAVIQALIAQGVIGDFRAPNIMRFGFAPLYLRHQDAVRGARMLNQILADRSWDKPEFLSRQAVT